MIRSAFRVQRWVGKVGRGPRVTNRKYALALGRLRTATVGNVKT